MLGSFFETKKSRNEQPIKEAQRELEALQRAGEQFQSTFDAISREGRDATTADYNILMQNA